MPTDSFQRRPSGELSPKASQGLVGHAALIQVVSRTTTKSFRVYTTLLCKRKAVKLPRAPMPAWSGACAIERVKCFTWHPFCRWLAALVTAAPLSSTKTSPGSLPFLFINCPVFCSCSSLLLSFFLLLLSLFVIPFPISNLSLPEDLEWWRLDAEEITLLINLHHEEAKSFFGSRR